MTSSIKLPKLTFGSCSQVKEGYHLLTRLRPQVNPYDSASCHTPPALLAFVGPLTQLGSEWPSYALWIGADVVTAWTLGRIASRRKRGKVLDTERERVWSPARVAAM